MLEALAMAAVIYTVKPGDNLYNIAKAEYGNGYLWPAIYSANKSTVGRNPDLIYPGERLRVPRHPRVTVSVRLSEPRRSHHRVSPHVSGGTLSCSGLESLWIAAGGRAGSAFIAAEIAEAESGGRQYATGPAGERGYWQIHPTHGALSTYNAYGNARAAVIISGNGSNWSPWTTYTSGAYRGRCLGVARLSDFCAIRGRGSAHTSTHIVLQDSAQRYGD